MLLSKQHCELTCIRSNYYVIASLAVAATSSSSKEVLLVHGETRELVECKGFAKRHEGGLIASDGWKL